MKLEGAGEGVLDEAVPAWNDLVDGDVGWAAIWSMEFRPGSDPG
jgi:hypothetical protein